MALKSKKPKEDPDVLHSLLKKCFGKLTKEIEEYAPDFQRVLSLKRVELFSPEFGLSLYGKPSGGFYSFVNDPKKQQLFFSAMANIFFQEHSSLLIKDLFPDSCFVVLSFIRSPEGDLLPENIRIAEREPTFGMKIKEDNSIQYKKLKACLEKGEIARIGINITTVLENKVVSSHAMNIVVQPETEKTILITMLDPANLDSFKINLKIGEEIAQQVKRKPNIYVPTYGVCRSSFQGNTDLCATWSMFLLLTHLVNPPAWWPRIERELLKMPENEANKMIFQFAWWFRKTFGNVVYEAPGRGKKTYAEIIDQGKLFRSKLEPLKIFKVPEIEW